MRYRRKLHQLEAAWVAGQVGERELQSGATALMAFARAAGSCSWQCRRAVLSQLPVIGREVLPR